MFNMLLLRLFFLKNKVEIRFLAAPVIPNEAKRSEAPPTMQQCCICLICKPIGLLLIRRSETLRRAGDASWSPGIYFYSLYVDNTLVDTKKMAVAK